MIKNLVIGQTVVIASDDIEVPNPNPKGKEKKIKLKYALQWLRDHKGHKAAQDFAKKYRKDVKKNLAKEAQTDWDNIVEENDKLKKEMAKKYNKHPGHIESGKWDGMSQEDKDALHLSNRKYDEAYNKLKKHKPSLG